MLVSPSSAEDWDAYHRIRRTVLFEKRGLTGVYDPNRPDEHAAEHFAKVLVCDARIIGVVRIDLCLPLASLRRLAIDEPWQRRGYGRRLLALAEAFARERGAGQMESSVAADAVAFYEKCGYHAIATVRGASVPMAKTLNAD